MTRHAASSDKDTMIVATETGILHRMELESPGKRFIPANPRGLQVHEDDHAPEAARRAPRAAPEVRVDPETAAPRARPDRAHGRDRLRANRRVPSGRRGPAVSRAWPTPQNCGTEGGGYVGARFPKLRQ